MDPPTPSTTASSGAAAATTTAASQSSDSLQSPQSQPQSHPPTSSLLPPPSTAPPSTPTLPHTSSPNPMASQPPPTSSQSRPSSLTRPWQPPQQPPLTPSTSGPPSQRGGIAIGVPKHQSSHSPQPAPFSSSFLGQHYGGLGRGTVSTPESSSTPNSAQMRPSMQGMHGAGMLGSGSQLRPGGIHQQRPPQQPSIRPPPSTTSQSPSSQGFPGHGLLRGSSVGSSLSPSPSTSQGTQPWLSSASQGKPPVPSPSFRPPVNSQPSLQQRSHIPQQPHPPLPAPSTQQQQMSSAQEPSLSNQPQEQFGQLPSRVQPSLPPQPTPRVTGPATQKPSSLTMGQAQPMSVPSTTTGKTTALESDESCTRIISKRSINELLNQIDPSEKLAPEVEDALINYAEEFVESITSFGCSLAKHRKSSTLEAKDILLHLERNWNVTVPGFSGDEVKSFKKPVTNDIHRERLAVIKKSIAVAEASNNRNAAGQLAGSAKSNISKTSANVLGSPNMKS
ncbi:transcription initiation factor TFIID subunit 12 isoform X1 [Punica granatum]|uniref:Transcription initiation factor TFIID subunit 12 isoform X1 n=1 Tax=Punica granatum TaxID=22663 RepID=A0A6P8CM67_PUNGR|nr:transcription initiation factor TFIID subunit 12 isoform X1 [Punica granatum]